MKLHTNNQKWISASAQLFTLLFLFFALLSCTKDKDDQPTNPNDDQPVEVRLSSGLQVHTKAINDQWAVGDSIGVFMIKAGEALANDANLLANNRKYKASAGGSNTSGFALDDGLPAVYYPNDGSEVRFIAYSPYRATPGSTPFIVKVDVSDQTKPDAIDLLYSANATNVAKSSNAVPLQFSHMLSKVTININTDNDNGLSAEELSKLTVKITGDQFHTTANFNLVDGSLTPFGAKETITALKNGSTYTALVIPQDFQPGLQDFLLEFSIAGIGIYTASVPIYPTFPTSAFLSGEHYSFTATINKSGVTVKTNAIADWNGKDNPAINGGAGAWKVGDYYPDPNVTFSALGIVATGTKPTGVVFWVDPADSRHGKIVGLDAVTTGWWSVNIYIPDANSSDNGMVNMKAVADYVQNQPSNWTQFPAFNLAHVKNGGGVYTNTTATGIWYLPSINELQYLFCAYNKKPFETWQSSYPSWWGLDPTANAAFNGKITDAGGDALTGSLYWSSTKPYSTPYALDFSSGELWQISVSNNHSIITIARF